MVRKKWLSPYYSTYWCYIHQTCTNCSSWHDLLMSRGGLCPWPTFHASVTKTQNGYSGAPVMVPITIMSSFLQNPDNRRWRVEVGRLKTLINSLADGQRTVKGEMKTGKSDMAGILKELTKVQLAGQNMKIKLNALKQSTGQLRNAIKILQKDKVGILLKCTFIVFAHGDVTLLIGGPYWITTHGLYPLLPC